LHKIVRVEPAGHVAKHVDAFSETGCRGSLRRTTRRTRPHSGCPKRHPQSSRATRSSCSSRAEPGEEGGVHGGARGVAMKMAAPPTLDELTSVVRCLRSRPCRLSEIPSRAGLRRHRVDVVLEHLRQIGSVYWSTSEQFDGDKVFLLSDLAPSAA